MLAVAAELARQESQGRQVSISQRQQQQRAVQQAVRQVDGPRSSLLWSSTTYTGWGRGERVKMNGHKPHALQGQHLPDQGRATYSSSKPLSRLCAAFPLMQSWVVNGGRVAQLLSLLLLRTFIPAGGQALGNLTSGPTKAAS